jgi:hypothetical protein
VNRHVRAADWGPCGHFAFAAHNFVHVYRPQVCGPLLHQAELVVSPRTDHYWLRVVREQMSMC